MISKNGKDFIKTLMSDQLVGIYYYGLNKNTFGDEGLNTKIFGFVPTLQSITYNPFLDMEDTQVYFLECQFDGEYYHWADGSLPKVYRLQSSELYTKLLGYFDLKAYFQKFSENYEPRMLHYPFRYFLLTDYINPPLSLKLENLEFDNQGRINFKVKIGLSNSSKYILYADGYKGDNDGNLEGLVNNNPLQYPVTSNAYASFMATQGNSYTANNQLALMENDKSYDQTKRSLYLDQETATLGTIGTVVGGLSSIIAGQYGSGVGQLVGAGINAAQNRKSFDLQNNFNQENVKFKQFSIEKQAMATIQDLHSTPRAIKSIGNDSTFTINNSNKRVDLIEYGMKPYRELQVTKFFNRYGVQTNEYAIPNIRNRKYWNFVKCTKANIDSSSIPYNELRQIENIFESGVTLWHIDNGAEMKDYNKINEVIE